MDKVICDKFLLEEVCTLCKELEKEDIVMAYQKKSSKEGGAQLVYPLDDTVYQKLSALLQKASETDSGELKYETNEKIDELWGLLIEKSIICLRFFDKREPFMEYGKHQYVYGMDKLEAYHKSYIDFEGVLYGSDAYYRDHIFHVIRVWLLGIYLLLGTNTHITGDGKPLIHQIHLEGEAVQKTEHATEEDIAKGNGIADDECAVIEKDGKLYKLCRQAPYEGACKDTSGKKDSGYFLAPLETFSSEINILEKISMWTIIALCHDLGYPLEKSKKVLEKTEKMMSAFVSNPYIEKSFRFDGTQDSNNLDIITFMSKKMKPFDARDEDGNVGAAKFKASIQDKYKFKYKLSLEDFSHGIVSAIIIYKMLIYFIETDNNPDSDYIFGNEDARQFYIRRDILRAISSHTCENIYHIDVVTLPMILFVCDELQEWGRKSWKSMYQGVANSTTALEIQAFNKDKIEYTEEINMTKASTNQLIHNIKRIIEKQYMLYLTTFRDGQHTALRKFNFIKHISITVNGDYRSISKIDINFSINHGSEPNQFDLTIQDSGNENTSKDQEKKVLALENGIEKIMDPYRKAKKYGNFTLNGKGPKEEEEK